MFQYEDFIKENVAPVGVKRIGVYNNKGKRVGTIKLGSLAKTMGEKLYSFGAISDVHLSVADSESDFARALKYLDSSKVAFTCICGDMTNNGNDTQLARYQELVSVNATTPVYAITGNHETYTHGSNIESKISTYTGKPLYYSFEYGNDVFIMLGIKSEAALFTDDELVWFQNTLEANRNKRCFIFQHCFTGYENSPTCGNANGIYHSYCWSGDGQTQLVTFKNLLAQYKNTVFFHGHSHLRFRLQDLCDYANFDNSEGYRSVHIPSISRPRVEDGSDEDTSPDYYDAGSEGYLVDVYENGIHLRGRDFVNGEFIPIASYWIDTTLVNIEQSVYNVMLELNNAISSNKSSSVSKNSSYTTTVSAQDGYKLDSVNVMMGSENITSSVYSNGVINIPVVTGDIFILVYAEEEEVAIPFTNQISISTDASGAVYNGKGFKENTYLSSGNEGTRTGISTTGFIPVKYGDVVRLQNVGFTYGSSNQSNNRITTYDANKQFLKFVNAGGTYALQTVCKGVRNANNEWVEFTVTKSADLFTDGVAYMRICAEGITADSIITINEPIE